MSDTVGVPREAIVIHPPWQFYAGDDWPIAVVCEYADGTPINLHTAASIKWIMASLDNATNIFNSSTTAGITISIDQADSSLCYVIVPKEATVNVVPGSYLDE